MSHIVLFDGVCNLCHGGVQFIIRRDDHDRFQFASLEGDPGWRLLQEYAVQGKTDSIVLIESRGKVSTESSAILRIALKLPRLYPVLGMLLIIPKFIRDPMYRFIASRRYRWFGKKEACPLPSKKQQAKFLDG